jgi:hypothetical protein
MVLEDILLIPSASSLKSGGCSVGEKIFKKTIDT